MTKRALVAGASGALGRHLVAELGRRGYSTRALVRDPAKSEVAGAEDSVVIDLLRPDRARLDAALEKVDVVVSAVGQPCGLEASEERRSFRDVDPAANRALLAAALGRGVGHFAYVAVLHSPAQRGLDYVAAHEDFVEELVAAEVEHTVIRANGFFYSYLDLLAGARRGPVPIFGSGAARSNPIHEAELAVACVDALEGGAREVEVGGPQELSRREEAELAFQALGRRPRLIRVPPLLLRGALPLIRLRDRRRAEMIEFLVAICLEDQLAPAHGTRLLGEYFSEQVRLRASG